MSDETNLGGKQQANPVESFEITHWNIAIECRREKEEHVLGALKNLMISFGASFKEVGGGPTRMKGRLCPSCGKIIHQLSRDCGQCGAKDIR